MLPAENWKWLSGTVVNNQSKMRPPSTAIADDPTRALLRQALEDNGVAFVNAPRASPGEDRAQATRGRSKRVRSRGAPIHGGEQEDGNSH